MSRFGTLIEFSKKDKTLFCIAEFENAIRIMGTLETRSKIPLIGQRVQMVKCEFNGNAKFTFQLE